MKSILDPTFRYTPAAETDLRKSFAKVRRELKRDQAERVEKVIVIPAPIRKGRK